MPRRKQTTKPAKRAKRANEDSAPAAGAAVRSFWSGTITFGLVSIPVDLLSAVRPRQTALKLVDKAGHALGRQYHCSKEGTKLENDELVRGYETADGQIVEITDAEFASVAPEMSGDIEMRSFVPLAQIPPLYFQKPYFLAPSGKSARAYHLLAATMEKTGRVGIGSFIMRGHEYLVAIVADHGVLRADTLRYADEIRTPEDVGLPKRAKAGKHVAELEKEIESLTRSELDASELDDQEAQALQQLVEEKQKDSANIIHQSGLEEADADSAGGAKVIDLMAILRKSLSKNAVVTTAQSSAPIDLAERRAQRATAAAKSTTTSKRKTPAQRKTAAKPARKKKSTRR